MLPKRRLYLPPEPGLRVAPRATVVWPHMTFEPAVKKSGIGWRICLWAILIIGVAAGVYGVVQQAGGVIFLLKKQEPMAQMTPAPTAPAASTTATFDPFAEAADAAARDSVRVQARIATVRAFESVGAQIARADFAGAAAVLEGWAAAHAEKSQGVEIERHAVRLRSASQVLPRMLQQPEALVGARIAVGDGIWPVVRVTDGQLRCRIRTKYGTVERPVNPAALGEADLLQLFQRIDAAQQTTLAPTYLLGLGRIEDVRALLKGDSVEAQLLRVGADEVEALIVDCLVLEALDSTERAMARREFAAAGAKLDELFAAHPEHEFLTIAYADQIETWREQIKKAPAISMARPARFQAAS